MTMPQGKVKGGDPVFVSKEDVLLRVRKYNAVNGRTVKAAEKVFAKAEAGEYAAGTNLVVEFVKEFVKLPYGDGGMALDKKADCSQFWINVLYYWFGIKDIGSYTEALYAAARGKHIAEKDIKPLCVTLYKLSNRNKHATHAAGYLGGGLMGDTRSRLNPFQIRSFNWKKDKITAIVDFLTDEQRASVIVQPDTEPSTPPMEPVVTYPKYKYSGGGLNIRAKASTITGKKIGFIRTGYTVEKLGEKKGWWNVKLGGITGWCKPNTKYFKIISF
jgi:hypothetical protein